LIILDAGSGLINLGIALVAQKGEQPLDIHLFLSHTHWDHLLGIPYFQPAYRSPGTLRVYGVAGMDDVLLGLFRGAQAGEYFPVPDGRLMMELVFHELKEVTNVGEAKVSYYYLNHPGLTLGFRIEYQGKSLVYLSDNEPYRATNQSLIQDDEGDRYLARLDREVVQFARTADLLIADASFADDEYALHKGEGLSSAHDALLVGISTQARKLVLCHHLPHHGDDDIDVIVDHCRKRAETLKSKLEILHPSEGDLIHL
jgi:phosphoribosyl 1,2-cyclic phosphodiesterase